MTSDGEDWLNLCKELVIAGVQLSMTTYRSLKQLKGSQRSLKSLLPTFGAKVVFWAYTVHGEELKVTQRNNTHINFKSIVRAVVRNRQ